MQSYWRITSPDGRNDCQHLYENGSGYHRWGFPSRKCEVCGETKFTHANTTLECPKQLRTKLDSRLPVSLQEFNALKKEFLEFSDARAEEVEPGLALQPLVFSSPTRLQLDFYWASLRSFLVIPKVAESLSDAGVKGIAFCPVKIEKIGTCDVNDEAQLKDLIEKSEKPEDIIDLAPPGSTEGCSLFEGVVLERSGMPEGAIVKKTCDECGRLFLDVSKRRLALRRSEIPKEADFFVLNTTLYILVSDRIKQIVEANRWSNVKFTPFEILD